MLLPVARNSASDTIQDACRIVAGHYYRERGLWVYRAWAWINETLFFNELPLPLITLGLTSHGACLAWTMSSKERPPIILLHPSLWAGTESDDPWSFPPDLLGPRFALDSEIHEAIHVSVNYRLGGPGFAAPADGAGKRKIFRGDSSHNNPQWIAEVNRIAPLLGLADVHAAMSVPKRKGKKIVRVCEGNIPFDVAATFPRALRFHWKRLDYYRDRSPLPFECNVQLDVTK
jgi:hypothetical protein